MTVAGISRLWLIDCDRPPCAPNAQGTRPAKETPDYCLLALAECRGRLLRWRCRDYHDAQDVRRRRIRAEPTYDNQTRISDRTTSERPGRHAFRIQ